MKAVRNARSRLIPEEVKAAIISLAKEGGKVHTVTEKDHQKKAGSTPQTKSEPPDTDTTMYAVGADKRFVEAWVKKNCNGNREAFKQWGASFPAAMVDKDNDGKLSMNMVNMRFVARLKSHSDDAAESFGTWFEQNHKQVPLTPEEVAAELEGEVTDAT
jgi:hypothetical protein